MRGGVSRFSAVVPVGFTSSPRAWGCFALIEFCTSRAHVFPTCVGVFLSIMPRDGISEGLPHVRGGVSGIQQHAAAVPGSSPRAWGCFSYSPLDVFTPEVFPTCVGVFLRGRSVSWMRRCLPHVRGGVSISTAKSLTLDGSSPRAWGCFRSRAGPPAHGSVFPTCVGVFPEASICGTPHPSLPHVRGGVSCSSGRRRVYRWSSPRAWGCFL